MSFGTAAASRSVAAGASETVLTFTSPKCDYAQPWSFYLTVLSGAGVAPFTVELTDSFGHVSHIVQHLTATGPNGARVVVTGAGRSFDLKVHNGSLGPLQCSAIAARASSASALTVSAW